MLWTTYRKSRSYTCRPRLTHSDLTTKNRQYLSEKAGRFLMHVVEYELSLGRVEKLFVIL